MANICVEDCDIDVKGSAISFSVEPGIMLRNFGDVTFRNIRLKSAKALTLNGTGDTPLRNMRFENVTGTIGDEKPIDISNVESICFDRFEVRSGRGSKSPPALNDSDGWERGL